MVPPVRLVPSALFDKVVELVHVHKHAKRAVAESKVTHERPFLDGSTRLGGLTVGVTVSELHAIRAKEGIELIQVVDFDGNSNLETVLWRKPLMQGARIELQGPALNTRYSGGGLPLDFRILGVGITGDAVDAKAHEAVSYTVEAKVHASDLVVLGGSSVAAAFAGMVGTGVGGTLARLVVDGCYFAVPLVGGLIALSSVKWAHKVLRSKVMPTSMKATAAAHAVSDCARIVFPVVGTLANAALVGVSLALQHKHRAEVRARAAQDAAPTE